MSTVKKALSVFLCFVMLMTTLCFFPLTNVAVEANASVVNTGVKTALYVPEVIYLYPDVTSWNSATSSPFQYYVGNTVDTENIYNAPVADANLETSGKIYFASEEGMSDVALSIKYLDLSGNYLAEADYGTVEHTKADMGTYYLFEITGGTSPELAAATTGAYIEWCITYTTDAGEVKAAFNYTYIYKPYVVPYGAVARVYNDKDDVNVFGQTITWVTGVHAIDNTATQTNTLYPYYQTVANSTVSSAYAFSPFLSKDNKAYVGGVEVTGAASVAYGGYNAVFSGTDTSTAYFWAGQTGASMETSNRARYWFYTASASNTYPHSFDYMNGSTVSSAYALSQVTPTRIGALTVDISRYENLNEIPNLAVGMMITDTDYTDALTSNTATPTAQWYVGDATGLTHLATGAYDTKDNIDAASDAVNTKFATEKNLSTPTTLGIKYAGAWNRAIDNETGAKTYTVKSYYTSVDRELDRQAVSSAISLNVNQVDKSALRETVNKATSYLGALGVKDNWNSYYYDITYVDPDTNASAWARFRTAYINACGALVNVDTALPNTAEEYRLELERSLDALLAGKGLRVYFDVNHDDIGINLWIPITESSSADIVYTWDAENETVILNGTDANSGSMFGRTSFTPTGTHQYTLAIEKLSGTWSGSGCTVIEPVDENNIYNFANTDGSISRYNFDNFSGESAKKTFTYSDEHFTSIEKIAFRTWYSTSSTVNTADNFTIRLKIEQGSTNTEYSPAGKVVGTTYGTLPTPTREGYLFDGWCTDVSLTEKVTAESAVSARILYAKWVKAQYNVVFDGNGNTSGDMSEQTMTYDESANLNANTYERTGYVFSGWKDAEGNSYEDGAQVLNLTSEHQGKFILYAQWTANQYSVAFDGNTGEGGLGVINCVYDTEFTLPENYFIKTGYTFAGWALSPDGEVKYTDKDTVKNLNSEVDGSVTLYAVWTPNVFTVKFDGNGNTSGEMSDTEVTYDSGVSLPECEFIKTGYTFVGWSLSADGELITALQYDNLCTENGDSVTLYAIWSENSYTLSFDANGGEGEKINPTVYGYEATVTLPKNVFTKTGYVLSGWSLTQNGEQVYSNGETVQHINADKDGVVTLYAVWTPITYTIKFDNNGGTGTLADISATYDTAYVLHDNTFTKEGYHFLGWSDSAAGSVVYADGSEAINLTSTDGETVTLYAVWEINTYTVTFEYYISDGTYVSAPVSVEHGNAAVVPNNFTSYVYYNESQHRVFDRWSTSFDSITEDIIVTARYSSTRKDHVFSVKTTEATCTAKGVTVSRCTQCAYTITTEIPMKVHELDDGEVTKEPGCITVGTKTYSCKNCTYQTAEAIIALGHSFTDVAASEPTCDKKGNIAHKHCSRCLKNFPTDAETSAANSEALSDSELYIATTAHTPGEAATCTTSQICTVCKNPITPALGHKYEITYKDVNATCTTEGTYTEVAVCSVCGDTLETEKTGKLPHSYTETVVDPTCVEAGYTKHTCSVCGDTYTDNDVNSLGHIEGEWIVTTLAKCLEDGIETNECARCGEGFKTRTITKTGHTPGDWITTTEPSCEGFGEATCYCTVCGEVYSVKDVAPKGHGSGTWEETLEAGCETAGKNSLICEDCGYELRFEIIPETGHREGDAADCENDQVCLNCGEVLNTMLGHSWDSGVLTKEPTEEEEGQITYTCLNDPSHNKYESVPKRIIIALPEIPADGTVDMDADENGNLGNINDMITVETGLDYTVSSSDTSVLTIDANGNMTAVNDGNVVITIKTSDGQSEKSFTATVRTLKTVTFDVNGVVTEVKAYVGDKVNAPAVESYTDENGYAHNFKAWTVDGAETTDFTVIGDMSFIAVFTSSCDYSELDRVAGIFKTLTSGVYDNDELININKTKVDNANALIDEFANDRDTRDIADQPLVNAAVNQINSAIASIYPSYKASIEIKGETECYAGAFVDVKAYLMPIDVEIVDGIWSSSDTSIGFFTDGKFFAVKAGTVTLTCVRGELSAEFTVTVKGGTGARVVMFDSLLTNANYIVEGSYVIKETTNLFWAPDAPIHFRVITDGTFEEYIVYINDKKATPAADGTYTIPANTGDAHVRIEGLVPDVDSDTGEKISFWEMILNFFRKIGDFFRSLFGM